MKKNIKFYHIRIIIYCISILIVAFVFTGKIATSCYFYDNFHILCPACGLTRATISFCRLNFCNAYNYNGFYTCVILPLALLLIINDIYIIMRRIILHKKGISFIDIIFGKKEDFQWA